ncbi:hypothetical protein BDV25DRAFT_151723 [Aspergillus avenaceus]|uniref:Uncharacterized protein n=1 Tax=Aspergillus avenaceus TaxID=36643 RepID=A0A5N6U0H9_ASPAV|nr:hypothetical protein BDV25DRAFT_151723 [Aspergillus avenaceus]
MLSNKPRLNVALYARGGRPKMPGKEDTYHWGLIVGPKNDDQNKDGVCYHAKESFVEGRSEWVFQEIECSRQVASMLLVRVLVGKVKDRSQLSETMRAVSIRSGEEGWNCVSWVEEALEKVTAHGKILSSNVAEWETIRNEAMRYCQLKKDEHRFDGKKNYDMSKVPTYDMMQSKEIVV